MNSLKTVVDLYRSHSNSDYNGETFSGKSKYTTELKKLIRAISSYQFSYGRFQELEIDGEEIEDYSEIPENGGVLNFKFLVSQSSAERFYASSKDLIKINKLMRGEIPEQYYIVDLDYYSNENQKPESISKIEAISSLIKALSKLSHFHDMKENTSANTYRLVFVLHSESKSSSSVIETLLTEEILTYNEVDISLINSLTTINPISDLHYDEKVNTFRNTLIEHINSTGSKFKDIIENWELICNMYRNNLAVYMSAFSFQKSRKEIAETEIEYADKISKITTEISNKALAIPISLVGSIAIYQLNGKIETYITFLGLVFTSLIITIILASQKKQLNRVEHAKNIVFTSIEKRIKDDKSDLKTRLLEAKSELDENVIFCRRVLDFLISISWVPVCIGTLSLLRKFL
ncbi:TPA: hypothetical protein RYX77_002207 [Serratia marcescens]|nr:hypothetical protein [Serratia marcescens]HEB0067436.1 hypothetical protein [Serratia marcescens]HEB0070232.1 hypothetical protein [Serratia marcescens]HEB0089006.1 hypothetical protein [Serratia marcescens]HEB0124751.1 hypothetical protein [Serratia marcescens]